MIERTKNKNKIKEFKRQKLEEIFILMDKAREEVLNPISNKGTLSGIGAKLAMTIRFYFKALENDYYIFLNTFSIISNKSSTKDGLTTDEIKYFYNEYKIFINKIVNESSKYI